MMSRLCIAATTLGLCSCAHCLECTAHGGPEWNEVQTAHFSVQSDVPVEDAKAAANEFESVRLLPGRQAKVGLVSNRIYAFYADKPLSLQQVQSWQAGAKSNPAEL